ncbi:MAG: GatB/YqeY domain-containing protein [Burkholderiales bacterium]
MALKEQIGDAMRAAMRAKDAPRLSAIRLLLAAIKQREIDERRELTDEDVVAVVDRMIKQRRESIAHFEKGGRQDLASAEKFEISVLQDYLPQAMTDAEIATTIDAAIASSGARAMADMGKVMAKLKPQLTGRTDMAKVAALVKAKLGT